MTIIPIGVAREYLLKKDERRDSTGLSFDMFKSIESGRKRLISSLDWPADHRPSSSDQSRLENPIAAKGNDHHDVIGKHTAASAQRCPENADTSNSAFSCGCEHAA